MGSAWCDGPALAQIVKAGANEILQHRGIDIGQFVDVKAGLAHLVFA